jgi:hypothetical protein
VREAPARTQRDAEREGQVADALRAEWRMFERVSVRPREDGYGFKATIELNQALVRGSAEQQCHRPSLETAAKLEARRRDAIAACVDRVNEKLPAAESIRDFVVLG